MKKETQRPQVGEIWEVNDPDFEWGQALLHIEAISSSFSVTGAVLDAEDVDSFIEIAMPLQCEDELPVHWIYFNHELIRRIE